MTNELKRSTSMYEKKNVILREREIIILHLDTYLILISHLCVRTIIISVNLKSMIFALRGKVLVQNNKTDVSFFHPIT